MTQQASGQGWFVEVTDQALDIAKYTQLVTDPAAGAISSFIGTTRNNFQGKSVLRLEYEAYVPMAVAKLKVKGTLLASSCRGELRDIQFAAFTLQVSWANLAVVHAVCSHQCALCTGCCSHFSATSIREPLADGSYLACCRCINFCLQELCQQLHSKWDVTHVAMAHRTGVVEVCEASVIIAVSSAHRKASLEVSCWLAA